MVTARLGAVWYEAFGDLEKSVATGVAGRLGFGVGPSASAISNFLPANWILDRGAVVGFRKGKAERGGEIARLGEHTSDPASTNAR
jgi:hypothetical protein